MKRLIISGIAAAGITLTFAPMAQAEPVSDMHSESPYIEGFYRELEGLGHGYLDQAWQVNDAAWVACRVWEAPGATYYDAVAVVDARGYSYDEASAIVEAAIHNLC